MSYISISTNQPSNGQRQLTEREPANLRNDFKVPIEINVGDTIELVSLKFNINAIVIDENNNRIVWSIGEAPFATYHCAMIPFGSYDSPIHLASGIATAFNDSTLLPNYQKQAASNHYGFTNIPGWTCVWDASGTIGKFVIQANQCESPGLKTNGSCANAYYTTLLGLGFDAATSRVVANGISVNNSLSFFAADDDGNTLPSLGGIQVFDRNATIQSNTGPTVLDNQIWSQPRWDPTSTQASALAESMFDLATDDTGLVAENEGLILEDIDAPTIWFDSESNQLGNNGGYSFETSRQSNTVVVESQEQISVTGESSSFLRDLGGVFNNGGRVRAEVFPLMGYKLTDFTTSANAVANFVGQTLTVNLQKYDIDGNSAPVDSTMVCAVVDPATNNGWNFSLTTTTLFDATGNGGVANVSVLWLTYLPDRTNPELGPLATYENGMFAMGYTVGGGAAAPPDANDPSNYNAFADPANLKARNYWYYDIGDGQLKCAYRENCVAETQTAFDEYTRPIRTNFCFDTIATFAPPAIFNPATLDMALIPTQPLGYPACKVGLNRRERFTPDFATQNRNRNAGFNSLADSTVGSKDDEVCEYSISINNGDPGVSGIKVDAATGARVPLLKLVCPKPFTKFGGLNNEDVDEDAKPVGADDWLQSHVIDEKRLDDATFGLAAFDPTKSIFLELKLDKNNVMSYTVAQETSSTVTNANPFPIELPAYTNNYTAVVDPNLTTILGATRLQESQFPLIPTIAVGGGGYYGIGSGGLLEHIGAAYKIDMSGPYRVPDSGQVQENPRLSFLDAYEGVAINQTFGLGTGNRINDSRKTIATNEVGATNAMVPRTTPVEANRENMAHYNAEPETPSQLNIANIFEENALAIANLGANTAGNTGIQDLNQTNISPPSATTTTFESINKITFNGIEDGLSVNLLAGNIRGYNGGTSDINKAVAYLQPEQLASTATGIGSRTFFHESKTSRPVEFNVPNNQVTHSMTVQLRNNNNELVRGIEAPVEVVLYKKNKDNELQEIRQVLNSIKSDRQGIKIQTAGDNNPLLGVIPR